jgi:hypothetical protein
MTDSLEVLERQRAEVLRQMQKSWGYAAWQHRRTVPALRQISLLL